MRNLLHTTSSHLAISKSHILTHQMSPPHPPRIAIRRDCCLTTAAAGHESAYFTLKHSIPSNSKRRPQLRCHGVGVAHADFLAAHNRLSFNGRASSTPCAQHAIYHICCCRCALALSSASPAAMACERHISHHHWLKAPVMPLCCNHSSSKST